MTVSEQAQQLMQEDPCWLRRKAAETLALSSSKNCHEVAEILLDVASLYDMTQEELYGSALLERLYRHAALVNNYAKEEAMRYARKEHELASQMKILFSANQ